VTSISRRLIFWLAVPLMLMAFIGALMHYFYNIAPSVISSDHRLKDAAAAVMSHVTVKDGVITLDSSTSATPIPARSDFMFAIYDGKGRRLAGDAQVMPVAMDTDASQLFSMAQIEHHSLRVLTTRFDTRGGTIFITVADQRSGRDSAAHYGFVSTLLWDFVQLDVTLVLVWIGIHLALRPVKRLRDEIAQLLTLLQRQPADAMS